ncbi:hypothetical protein BBW65_00690 [Helicobacter enhydrae]|uniref:RNA-binding S4 domain-containing protein n=1 Tax=Helicobacter enhydrae TaxID=222136 RepID=A0A1B1U3T7_9HELI|nr:RNA-binding S4 domain-containing protein [Helicobacter enhydrae]ANV97423.1 hypothetical protein BBW65_00690 [Helicobacter enhydrae]
MRLDQFLNSSNLLKRRSIAQDMCQNGAILLNAKPAKPAKEVKIGDVIELKYLDKSLQYEILAIPPTKTTPKSQISLYLKELQ